MKKIVTMLCTLVLGVAFIHPCNVLMAADYGNPEEDDVEKPKRVKKQKKGNGEHHYKKKKKEDSESN